ncbi:helix-turn-helix domain-containing protein [Camelimonas abortus]|uniref:Helix-turn-helix domain-containing protein n=1 Tax=Camelimonas abortus TaxID=1017184 RepID=A0ABV7LCI0_9HYPH
MAATSGGVGAQLKEWRARRRMSQLDLACEAGISTRHLSFVETGRAQPSREMLLLLAERLAIPLRERNALLVAAGYAPMFPERSLDDPDLAAARAAIAQILKVHDPWPALAVDRHWNMVTANAAVPPLLAGVAPALLAAPVNVLRLSLHPEGLAPRILNYHEWRDHILHRLRRQIDQSADAGLAALHDELQAYPAPVSSRPRRHAPGIVAPLQLAVDGTALSFISVTTVFGAPLDVTLSELAMETFFPVDETTSNYLQAQAAARERDPQAVEM